MIYHTAVLSEDTITPSPPHCIDYPIPVVAQVLIERNRLVTPLVQISLDFTTLDAALPVAEAAVRAGVDWLEVGTPLALGEGVRAVRALRERFPQHPIIADIKCMDGGYSEAVLMLRAGATHVVVMALAHPATVAGAVRAAREHGGSAGCPPPQGQSVGPPSCGE